MVSQSLSGYLAQLCKCIAKQWTQAENLRGEPCSFKLMSVDVFFLVACKFVAQESQGESAYKIFHSRLYISEWHCVHIYISVRHALGQNTQVDIYALTQEKCGRPCVKFCLHATSVQGGIAQGRWECTDSCVAVCMYVYPVLTTSVKACI